MAMDDTKPPAVSENPAEYGALPASKPTETTYAAMLRAVKIDRLANTAPENEGAENRFHRAGCERISFDHRTYTQPEGT
jgi:hypothetical protein